MPGRTRVLAHTASKTGARTEVDTSMTGPPVMVSLGDDGILNHELSPALADVWLDRDLGWLDFNDRVLAEALDPRNPLLERAKFLAIFTSNLDEFFMKRVAVLRAGCATPE